MAAPGIGVGDIVDACKFIYGVCVKYKDAPKEFEEVADKAKATAVILTRLDDEARMGGSLVNRAGPEAYDQLQQNLKSLRSDSEKLDKLVAKYERIHDEGPGRRLLWALKESGDLTDMRRQIGYHEQKLQLWYMTLVYGSLRRLEGGQEEIIEALKSMQHGQLQEIMRALHHGDRRPLERELKRKGVSQQNIEANLVTAVDYIEADPVVKIRMESQARSMSTAMRPSSHESGPHSNLRPQKSPSYPKDDEIFYHKLSHLDLTKPHSGVHRSRSAREPTTHYDKDWLKDDRSNNFLSVRKKSRPGKESRSESPKELIMHSGVHRSRSTREPTRHYDEDGLKDDGSNNFLSVHKKSKPDKESKNENPKKQIIYSGVHQNRSTKELITYDEDWLKDDRSNNFLSVRKKSRPGKESRSESPKEQIIVVPQESSSWRRPRRVIDILEAPLGSSLLSVPSNGPVYRSDSEHRRTRSSSRARNNRDSDASSIIIVNPRRHRSESRGEGEKRDSSTHSYHRTRRSSSRGSDREERAEKIKLVTKMDRIDSVPVDE